MDTSQPLFLMHITDGYSVRNIIGIIKRETEFATMIVSPKEITISFLNTSKCAVHKIVLNTGEFTKYEYNIKDNDGNLVDECPITFDTNEMFNTTKGIGRRDGIRLYWLPGDNKINVQPIKTSTKDPGRAGALFVKILSMEHTRYDVGTHSLEPNVKVQAKDFADLCSQAGTLKCTSVEIVGHNAGVTFKGMRANQTMASINRFMSQTQVHKKEVSASNMNELDDMLDNLRISNTNTNPGVSSGISLNVIQSDELTTAKVPILTVKALSKIHNISPSGTLLRFWFARGEPTKIESPIGTYGHYIICLR